MPDVIPAELRQVLRRLKLSPVLETLPERLQLARQQKLPHQDFLELVLADEAARRDRIGADLRARAAQLDPAMRFENWDDSTAVTFDRQLWNELCSLRFLDEPAGVLILGPVGVGKTMLANCLGHIACRRRRSVLCSRSDQLFRRLKAARLDASYELELRRLLRVDLLISTTSHSRAWTRPSPHDLYQVVVERHRRASTILTSNREPQEWLAMMADPMLAQSAVDRIVNSAYELVLEGDSTAPDRSRAGGRHEGPLSGKSSPSPRSYGSQGSRRGPLRASQPLAFPHA